MGQGLVHRRQKSAENGRRAAGVPAATNLILNAIPPSEYQIILPSLEEVTMDWHTSLHAAKEPFDFGYFPSTGLISMVVPMNDGRSAEVGMVGREGFVGA